MNECNVFNINKGELSRYEHIWTNQMTETTSGFYQFDIACDCSKYSMFYVTFVTERLHHMPGSSGTLPTYKNGPVYTSVIVNDSAMPYKQVICHPIRSLIDNNVLYRTMTMTTNGISVSECVNKDGSPHPLQVIPLHIYGIR